MTAVKDLLNQIKGQLPVVLNRKVNSHASLEKQLAKAQEALETNQTEANQKKVDDLNQKLVALTDELTPLLAEALRLENEPPAQEPPAQEPPAQEPLAQEPPAQEPPAQEPPAQEPPAQEPPAQEPPAQEPPAQEPPAQEPPAPIKNQFTPPAEPTPLTEEEKARKKKKRNQLLGIAGVIGCAVLAGFGIKYVSKNM